MDIQQVPIIDISPLIQGTGNITDVANKIGEACREVGFFYISGHGINPLLERQLEEVSQAFFEQSQENKMKIRMALGGKAWRGYFPVGDELTSGKPDLKEGLYFGTELPSDDPRVIAGIPLHGSNLFPNDVPRLREVVLKYIDAMTELGHCLMEGIALSLGLEASFFADRYTTDPLTLFRIFHYPSSATKSTEEFPWGVGEHTDYGVLTILKQDETGGLQVKSRRKWLHAPFIPSTFICNIGDMLDRMTGGLYLSTPHRVRNESNRGRYSFPFFFDPNFDAKIQPIPLPKNEHLPYPNPRWDGANLYEFDGTYGDYILAKVSKVFPELKNEVDSDP